MPQIPIWIINLPQHTERFTKLAMRLDELQLAYERKDAVVGKELTDQQKHKICPTMRLDMKSRRPSDGEIGCYASHMNAFREVVEQKLDRVCILEDDAIVSDDFSVWVQDNTPLPYKCNILKLSGAESRIGKHTINIDEYADRKLCFQKELTLRTTGYVISYEGAKKALQTLSQMYAPIDHALFEYWNSGLSTIMVLPYPITFTNESVIEQGRAVEQTKNNNRQLPFVHKLQKIKRSATRDLYRICMPVIWFGTKGI